MGPWNSQNQFVHCHGQVGKEITLKEKFEFQGPETFQLYGMNALFCGVMPYEYSVPIPGTPLCAHICRPSVRHQRGGNCILRVVNMHTSHKAFYPSNGHTDLISNVAVDGNVFVTCSLDSTVKVWDIHPESQESLKLRYTLQGHTGWVNGKAQYRHIVKFVHKESN
jgi:hypothetical protein